MFANAFQTGFLSLFYSVGSSPLSIWDKQVKNGHIRRIVDDEVKSLVLEISGTNVATTYITTPIKPRASLGIRLPFLVLIIKNMKKYFTFEIQILDDKDMHRRFRVSNFQSTTKVRPFCTTMPIGLSTGWNQIQFNLADFTRRAYGTVYIETMRVQIHANARIRRIYFSDRLYSDEEMPNEYKLFMPTQGSERRPSKDAVAAVPPAKKLSVGAEPRKVSATFAATAGAPGAGEMKGADEPDVKVEGVEPIEVPQDDGEMQGAPPTPAESEMASPEAQEEEGAEPIEHMEPIEGEETDQLASPDLVGADGEFEADVAEKVNMNEENEAQQGEGESPQPHEAEDGAPSDVGDFGDENAAEMVEGGTHLEEGEKTEEVPEAEAATE